MRVKRVITGLLAAVLAVETMFAPMAVAASEVNPLSSVAGESSSIVPEVSEVSSSIISDVSSVVPGSSSVVSSSSDVLNADSSSSVISSIVDELSNPGNEQEDTAPVLLEEKKLLADMNMDKKEMILWFPVFADADTYAYEVTDKEGASLASGELEVAPLEIKGALGESFDKEKNFMAKLAIDESWPEEFTLSVYDAAKTSYITCALYAKDVIESVTAETKEEEKTSVVWTVSDADKDICNGYLVQLIDKDGNLIDSVAVNTTSCSFNSTAKELRVRVIPVMDTPDDVTLYYNGAENNATFVERMPVKPTKVTGLKATAGDQSVKLIWSASENADAYNLYTFKDGETTFLTTVTAVNYTITNLSDGVSYSFCVESVNNEYGKLAKGDMSAVVSATPYISKPKAPTGLSGVNSKGTTTLTWKKNGTTDGFIIYSYDYNKKKYVEIGRTTSTRYTYKKAGNADKYKYLVKAYRKGSDGKFYYSDKNPEILVYAKETVDTAKSIHPIYYSARITRKTGLYRKFRQDKTKEGTIKPGERVTVVFRRWKQSQVSYRGKVYYVYNGAMRITGQSYTTKDYSKQVKEYYVNSNGYKSSSKYLIWISTYTQRINVFEGSKGNWKLIKTEKCVTGKSTNYTPMGTFNLYKKVKAHYYGRNYYMYLSYFSGDNKIHTRPARRKTKKYLDARLGVPISNGCVRVTDSLGKWIYNNVPKKSTIVVR